MNVVGRWAWFFMVATFLVAPERTAAAEWAEVEPTVVADEMLLGCEAAFAAIPLTEPGGWTFYWENDSFQRADQAYTNGLRFGRSLPARPRWGGRLERAVCASSWARRRRLAPCAEHAGEAVDCWRYSYGWSVGQNIYTPADLSRRDLIVEDRPYGGWLYRGFTLQLRRPDHLHAFELDVGVVGPISLAEPVQRGWHELLLALGAEPVRPRGWDNQIGHEPALQLLAETQHRAPLVAWRGRRVADVAGHAAAAIGSVFDHVGAGATVRLGYNLPDDFGPGIIPALAASERSRTSVHAFYRFEARRIWLNKFLDGNFAVFGESHSVAREPVVRDHQIGLSLRMDCWPDRVEWLNHLTLTVTQVRRSHEFVGQPGPQRYDSLAIAYSP